MPGSAANLGGRPRNPRIDEAVLEATVEILDTAGYGNLTIEAVARRAGASKPALYRRWATRQELVLAALRARLGQVTAPDTGCTLCDIDECLRVNLDAFQRMPPGVLASLSADCTSEHLRNEFMRALFEPPRDAVRATLRRAYALGDLRDDIDQELVVDLLGSFIHYRTLFGHAGTSADEISAAVRALLQGIATDYPGLVEHSERMEAERAHVSHR